MLWLAFVVGLIVASIVLAALLKGDFVQILGFLVASSIATFMLSAAAWLALYGVSILLEGVEYHKTHCDDRKYWASIADFIP